MEFQGLPKPEIKQLLIKEIVPNDYNPQELSKEIYKGLVKHIQVRGFTSPINVRPLDKKGGDPQSQPWVIIDGQHRLRAFMEAFPDEPEITCAVIKGKDGKCIKRREAIVSTIAYNNLHGEENPAKMAMALKLVLEGGMLIEDIVELTGMKRNRIETFLEFENLPPVDSSLQEFTGLSGEGPKLREPIIISFAVYPEDKKVIDKAIASVKSRLAPEIDIDEERGKCLLLIAQIALGIDSEPHEAEEGAGKMEVAEKSGLMKEKKSGKGGQEEK